MGSTAFTLSADDNVFAAGQLTPKYDAFFWSSPGIPPTPLSLPPGAASVANGGRFTLPATSNGYWYIDFLAESPCYPPSVQAVNRRSFVLDTTAPAINILQPAFAQYTPDTTTSIEVSVDDGPLGSGVASTSTADAVAGPVSQRVNNVRHDDAACLQAENSLF